MRHSLIFAWRNLWRNQRRTLITMSSIVFAVIIASFMRGMQNGSYEKMLNDAIKSTTGHLSIMDKDYWDSKTLVNSIEYSDALDSLIKTDELSQLIAPEIATGCLASSGTSTRGVGIMGVDPAAESIRSGLDDKITSGRYLDSDGPGVVLGEKLAKFLHLAVGDSLVLLGQGFMGVTAAAELEVIGIFAHPMPDIEKRLVYMNLATAEQIFYMQGRRTGIPITLNDYSDLDIAMARYQGALDTSIYEVKPWQEMNKVILQQIESDNFFGVIIIGILYLVIGFGIFGTVLMMVMERRREFSVMMALGMKSRKLVSIVFLETFMMGSIAAIVGLLLSFPVVYYFHMNPIPITGEAAEMYREFNIDPVLEVALNPLTLIWQFVIVFLMSAGAALYPVTSISKFDFVAIIRGRQ